MQASAAPLIMHMHKHQRGVSSVWWSPYPAIIRLEMLHLQKMSHSKRLKRRQRDRYPQHLLSSMGVWSGQAGCLFLYEEENIPTICPLGG